MRWPILITLTVPPPLSGVVDITPAQGGFQASTAMGRGASLKPPSCPSLALEDGVTAIVFSVENSSSVMEGRGVWSTRLGRLVGRFLVSIAGDGESVSGSESLAMAARTQSLMRDAEQRMSVSLGGGMQNGARPQNNPKMYLAEKGGMRGAPKRGLCSLPYLVHYMDYKNMNSKSKFSTERWRDWGVARFLQRSRTALQRY